MIYLFPYLKIQMSSAKIFNNNSNLGTTTVVKQYLDLVPLNS